jgi:hypothetical protein
MQCIGACSRYGTAHLSEFKLVFPILHTCIRKLTIHNKARALFDKMVAEDQAKAIGLDEKTEMASGDGTIGDPSEPTVSSVNTSLIPSTGQATPSSAGQNSSSQTSTTTTQAVAGPQNSTPYPTASAAASSPASGANVADSSGSSSTVGHFQPALPGNANTSQALSNISDQNSASKTTNPGIPAEKLAGGIVGAFFGGAILALMAAYIFSQRRKSFPYRTRSSKAVESVHGTSTRKSLRIPTVTNAWERLIPQPVDDETMGSLVKSLLDRVALHVDNFYARKSLPLSTSDLESLAKVDTKLLPVSLSEIMMDPTMQMLAIKHCIAFTLTDSITPGDDPGNKLLPIYLATLPRKLAPDAGGESDMKGKHYQNSDC